MEQLRLILIAGIIVFALPCNAQQIEQSIFTKATTILQIQRNHALDDLANTQLQLELTREELERTKNKLNELERKKDNGNNGQTDEE